jgi:hypothetical protein
MGYGIFQSLSQSFVFLGEAITRVDPLCSFTMVAKLHNGITTILPDRVMSWL